MGIDVTEFRADIDRKYQPRIASKDTVIAVTHTHPFRHASHHFSGLRWTLGILRKSDLATITSRKVRKQLEAEKCVCLSRVRRPLDMLINRCYRAIRAPSVRTAAPAVVQPKVQYESNGLSQCPPGPSLPLPCRERTPYIQHSMPGIGPVKHVLHAKKMSGPRQTPIGYINVRSTLGKMNAKIEGKPQHNPNQLVRPSPQLAALLQVEQTTKDKAVALFHAYIRAHKVQTPVPNGLIKSDAKLKAVTGKDHFYSVEVPKFVSNHISVVDEPVDPELETDDDEPRCTGQR
ncbi:hypothetical protein H4R34_003842 [Dimargaris verticillata]|uniref:SWIB domain-containing protein n=1 Tax=Dimargaris verticillata TaxID=2761393 RepID=A0A9W8ECS3_9FUNG|nr:hypothetical protein H4R34_003842 [Dimargaris verticillata]